VIKFVLGLSPCLFDWVLFFQTDDYGIGLDTYIPRMIPAFLLGHCSQGQLSPVMCLVNLIEKKSLTSRPNNQNQTRPSPSGN